MNSTEWSQKLHEQILFSEIWWRIWPQNPATFPWLIHICNVWRRTEIRSTTWLFCGYLGYMANTTKEEEKPRSPALQEFEDEILAALNWFIDNRGFIFMCTPLPYLWHWISRNRSILVAPINQQMERNQSLSYVTSWISWTKLQKSFKKKSFINNIIQNKPWYKCRMFNCSQSKWNKDASLWCGDERSFPPGATAEVEELQTN